jgi:outer membrane protein
MRTLVLLVMMGFCSIVAQAQSTSTKIGYADVDYIFSQMPEAKQIDTELKSLQNQLKNQIEAKANEFQRKYQDYQQNLNTMLEAVRANTERELQQLQQNLQKLQEDAQTTIQNRQTQLMDPVYKKVGQAIEDTAKENGFNMILSQQIGGLDVVLFADETTDVSDLVLKKMGVTPKPQGQTPPQAEPQGGTQQQPAPAQKQTPKTGNK